MGGGVLSALAIQVCAIHLCVCVGGVGGMGRSGGGGRGGVHVCIPR